METKNVVGENSYEEYTKFLTHKVSARIQETDHEMELAECSA